MNVRRAVLPALVALVAALPSGPAHADGPAGVACAMASVVRYGVTEAVLAGGPIAATGTLTCTVQVGAATHSGADTVSASASGVGVVVLPPTARWFPPATQRVYLCTQFTPALGAPLYWTPDEGGRWSSDPGVPCGDAFFGVLDLLADVLEPIFALCEVTQCDPLATWDPLVCPVFASFVPGLPPTVEIRSDGDLYVAGVFVYDCPPYDV